MRKKELMDELIHLIEQKQKECDNRLQALDSAAATERKALSIQKNLYKNAQTFVSFAGQGDEFPPPFMQRMKHLLAGEDALRDIFEQAEGEEQAVLGVYIHCMLFIRQNFLDRYKQEAKNTTDPEKQIEISLKIRIIEDLMASYRTCYMNLGGRKDLMI